MALNTQLLKKIPPREKCIYTSCYCEENVWHLCQVLTRDTTSDMECYCVFMSNPSRAVHLWKQKLCSGVGDEEKPVIWVGFFQDYHVFAMYGNKKVGYCVLDLDTILPFPVKFKDYASKAIRSNEKHISRRYFRVIPAQDFLKNFSSDRRHMKSSNKTSPTYPPIISNPKNPHNLDEFINMEKEKGFGTVFDCDEFIQHFS